MESSIKLVLSREKILRKDYTVTGVPGVSGANGGGLQRG
jgi:hypothetical protein